AETSGLRDKKTKSGAFIDPQPAHEIAKHITILNEATAQPEMKESVKQHCSLFRQTLWRRSKKATQTECHFDPGEGETIKESFAARKEERAQSFQGQAH